MKTFAYVSAAGRLIICVVILAVFFVQNAAAGKLPFTLFDFDSDFDISKVEARDTQVSLSDGALLIKTGHSVRWPGITLKSPRGKWDLADYLYLTLDVHNLGSRKVVVSCRVDNPGADGRRNCVTGNVPVDPRKKETLTVALHPTPWVLSQPREMIGMRGYPRSSGQLDTSNVTQLLVYVSDPKTDHSFMIDNVTVDGTTKQIDARNIFPMIDEFGQFIHDDWPCKIHSEEELKNFHCSELKDIASNVHSSDRNEYGGWTGGAKLKAGGKFRVEKYKNKWWLVDPDGCLFWSHGINCIRLSNSTPISDREHYFFGLPDENTLLSRFYGTGNWAPHGYYKDHLPYKTYDFGRANSFRKYGTNFENTFADMAHKRLKSWGMNTIANWSSARIYLMRKTPYTGTLNTKARKIAGSDGYWTKFPDVFDESFRNNFRKRIAAEKGKSLNDPWCIGYFVDNELGWGDEFSLAEGTLASPADQPAKIVFVNDLKAKYKTIEKLNAAWGTDYALWDGILKSRQIPDRKKAGSDLKKFYTKIAETYFKTIRDEINAAAPGQLYMGCRFAWVNDRAARAAAKYCDVVSYNRYRYSVADLQLPDNIDKPVIIGEFHFGALDRGMFHTGLRKAENQSQRAAIYKGYVQGALRNPYIVGTHWFQYQSQATTGRGDGENYQIGFIDICGTPYHEIINASRQTGKNMYEYRQK